MKTLIEDEDYSLPLMPLVALVFQLLIFILLATTANQEEHPPPRTAGAANVIDIQVLKDGSLTLGGQEIEMGELENRLKEAGQAREKPGVVVRGDGETPHGTITQIYQLCVRCNLTEIFDPVVYDARPAP